MLLKVLYILACLTVGVVSHSRRMGFWGGFFGSMLLTPIFGTLLVLVSAKVDKSGSGKAG